MIVLLLGDTNGGKSRFLSYVKEMYPEIMWTEDRMFLYHNALIVNFGGSVFIPPNANTLTWSGDDDETLDRIFKRIYNNV